MRVLAILQARYSSSRLPGKVLLPLADQPMLYQQIKRVERAKKIDKLVVATSTEVSDDPIASMCEQKKISCFRGSLDNVLDRFYQATKNRGATHIVRLTGDCPLIDPKIIDEVINVHLSSGNDYTSNVDPPTFPDGLDVEVMTFEALEKAWICAKKNHEKEHVTPYIRENSKTKMGNYFNNLDLSKERWTVDEELDYKKVEKIYEELYTNDEEFGYKDVISFLEVNPEVDNLNSMYKRNEGSIKSMKKDMDKYLNGSGQKLYKKAKKIIPGGTQLLSKRPEMLLPELWPSYYKSARGIEVTDLDGNQFIDMSHNAIGTCIFGAADSDVNTAVIEAVSNGVSSTLNCPEEVELAELLCDLHPWASKVRYARTGGEAMAMAVRIARARSGKDKVAFCGYHGWHDWYLAANLAEDKNLDGHLLPGLSPRGVPRGLKGTSIPFTYNDIQSLEKILIENKGGLAAIVMEPLRYRYPENGFLNKVKQLAIQHDISLIFDEITVGFRLCPGGAHLVLEVEPDIAVFGKAISNGHPMAAVIGSKKLMESSQDTFISSTYWTDRIGPVAALATINKYVSKNVHMHLNELGAYVKGKWTELAAKSGLKVNVGGIDPLGYFQFDYDEANEMRTLFTQEMLRRGYLATGGLYLTYAHNRKNIDCYLEKVQVVFDLISRMYREGNLSKALLKESAHAGFKRLN